MIVSKKIKRKETFDGLVIFLRFHPLGVVFYNLLAPAVELKTEVPGYLSRGNSAWLDSFIISSASRRLRLSGIRSRQSLVAAQLKDEPDSGVQWRG